jgi:hypothetical protein
MIARTYPGDDIARKFNNVFNFMLCIRKSGISLLGISKPVLQALCLFSMMAALSRRAASVA